MLVPLLSVSPGILSFSVQIGKPLTGHTGDVYSLALCPDGKTHIDDYAARAGLPRAA
jgi:hypothetical protein